MTDSVVTRISNLLPMLHSDTRANLVFTSDGELTRLFNEGLREHGRMQGSFVQRNASFVTLVQSVVWYNLPGDILDVIRVALDGVALVPATTTELEVLDEGFQYTQGTPTHWYTDRGGINRIAVYPVADAVAASKQLDIIYHGFICNLDEAHTSTTFDTPLVVGDMLELRVLAESYGKESDFRMPEVSQAAKQVKMQLYEPGFRAIYGPVQ